MYDVKIICCSLSCRL